MKRRSEVERVAREFYDFVRQRAEDRKGFPIVSWAGATVEFRRRWRDVARYALKREKVARVVRVKAARKGRR